MNQTILEMKEESQVYDMSHGEKRRALFKIYLFMLIILGLTFFAMGMQMMLMLEQSTPVEGEGDSVTISYVPPVHEEVVVRLVESTSFPYEEVGNENSYLKEVEIMGRKLKIGEVYTHFKGKQYLALYTAENVDTSERMVIYQQLDTGRLYVRRLEEFLSKVDKRKYPLVEQEWRFQE